MRRSLTPKERLTMWNKQQGRCKVCDSLTLMPEMIAEHVHPVALGNSEKPDCLLCKTCADRKTNGTPATTYGSDSHEIAKTKRLAKGGKKVRQPFPKPPAGYKHQWPKRKVGQ